MGFSETEPLVIFRTEIDFSARPNPNAKKQIDVGSLTEVIVRDQALGSFVG
jgi:hypothetical protein